jgi:hypothetical protein
MEWKETVPTNATPTVLRQGVSCPVSFHQRKASATEHSELHDCTHGVTSVQSIRVVGCSSGQYSTGGINLP